MDNFPTTTSTPGFQHREQLTPHIAYNFSKYLIIQNLDKNFENYAHWEQLDLDETQILQKRLIGDAHLKFASHAVIFFRSEQSAIANMVTITGKTVFGNEIFAFHVETWLTTIMRIEKYLMQKEPDYSQQTKVLVTHSDPLIVSRNREEYFRTLFSVFGGRKKFYFFDKTDTEFSSGFYVSFNFFSEAFASVLALDNAPVPMYGTRYVVNLERSLRLHLCILRARFLRHFLGPRGQIPWTTNGDENNSLPNVPFNLCRYLLIQNLDTSVETDRIWEALCIPPDVITTKRVYVNPHDDSSYLAVVAFADSHEAVKEALRLHDALLFGKQIKTIILQLFLEFIMKLEIFTLYWDQDYNHASSIFLYDQKNQISPELESGLKSFCSQLGTVTRIHFFDYHPVLPYPLAAIQFQFLSEAFAAQMTLHHAQRPSGEDGYIVSMDKNVNFEIIKMLANITDIQSSLETNYTSA